MYAVLKTGGKQYRVTSGNIIKIEKIAGVAGDKIKFDEVLYASDGKTVKVGSPNVEKSSVEAEILEQARADKIIVFKKKRRHNYRRTKGHRQEETVVKINSITVDGKKFAAEEKAKKPASTKAKTSDADEKTVKKTEEKPKASPKAATKDTAKKTEAKKTEAKKTTAKPAAKAPTKKASTTKTAKKNTDKK